MMTGTFRALAACEIMDSMLDYHHTNIHQAEQDCEREIRPPKVSFHSGSQNSKPSSERET